MGDIDIVNYADDNTPYVTADDIDGVIAFLENASNTLFKWFSDNLFKGNAFKCHLLVNVKHEVNMKVGYFRIMNSECEKLSGVKFDYRLTFNSNASGLCKNASQKMYTLARVAPNMTISKRCILIECFFQITI